MEVANKIISNVLIKELPQMRVAAYRVISLKPERDSSNCLKKIIEANGLDYKSLAKYGVDIPIPTQRLYRKQRGYESWVCIPDEIGELEGAKIKTILKGRYAVLKIRVSAKDPLDSISKGWLELQDWIMTNNYSTALHNPNRYMIEKPIEIENVSYLELYFPL